MNISSGLFPLFPALGVRADKQLLWSPDWLVWVPQHFERKTDAWQTFTKDTIWNWYTSQNAQNKTADCCHRHHRHNSTSEWDFWVKYQVSSIILSVQKKKKKINAHAECENVSKVEFFLSLKESNSYYDWGKKLIYIYIYILGTRTFKKKIIEHPWLKERQVFLGRFYITFINVPTTLLQHRNVDVSIMFLTNLECCLSCALITLWSKPLLLDIY